MAISDPTKTAMTTRKIFSTRTHTPRARRSARDSLPEPKISRLGDQYGIHLASFASGLQRRIKPVSEIDILAAIGNEDSAAQIVLCFPGVRKVTPRYVRKVTPRGLM
jgi:hypothetical protein